MAMIVYLRQVEMSWKCWAYKIQHNHWMCLEKAGIQNIKYQNCRHVQVPMIKIPQQQTHQRWLHRHLPHKRPIQRNQWPILCQPYIHLAAIKCYRIKSMEAVRLLCHQSTIWTRTTCQTTTKTFTSTNRLHRMRFSINHNRVVIKCHHCLGTFDAFQFWKKRKNNSHQFESILKTFFFSP